MSAQYFAFGEILWDCLPSGRHAGGAPFNVAVHLAQLGAEAAILSAVGEDALGDEIVQVAGAKGVETAYVERDKNGLPTGTVQVTLDSNSDAAYEIVQPVAWDEIRISPQALSAVYDARALVFGSLACRSPNNRELLRSLLTFKSAIRFFDVNLRPPFVDPQMVFAMARYADVLKLNDDELGLLAAFAQNSPAHQRPVTEATLAQACEILSGATGTQRICVTRGVAGAAFWEAGALITAAAPAVTVKDTVGAGDAFMAGLIMGLTTGRETSEVLTAACRLGAYVASQHGATPLLPPELSDYFRVT
jgi:fructokinase